MWSTRQHLIHCVMKNQLLFQLKNHHFHSHYPRRGWCSEGPMLYKGSILNKNRYRQLLPHQTTISLTLWSEMVVSSTLASNSTFVLSVAEHWPCSAILIRFLSSFTTWVGFAAQLSQVRNHPAAPIHNPDGTSFVEWPFRKRGLPLGSPTRFPRTCHQIDQQGSRRERMDESASKRLQA